MTFAPQSLRRLPIFAALADTERRVIAPAASLRHLARGECAFSEGAPVGEFFLILSGHVKLSRASRHRGGVILRIAHPGEPFGPAGGTQGSRQTTTAIAQRDCLLAVWPIETWNRFLHDMPGLANLAHRIKGGARIIKAQALIEACERLEAACNGVHPGQLTEAVDELHQAMERLAERLA